MNKIILILLISLVGIIGISSTKSSNVSITTIQDEKIIEEFNPARVLKYEELKRHLELGLRPDNVMFGKVKRVIDADTIEVLLPGEDTATPIKMLLIDCPKENQLFGTIAINYIKEALTVGSTIYIERDIVEKDLYDRQMGYIWYKSAGEIKLLNEELAKEGLAKSETIYKVKRHANRIKEAEYDAIASKKNIWSIDGYVINNGFNDNILK